MTRSQTNLPAILHDQNLKNRPNFTKIEGCQSPSLNDPSTLEAPEELKNWVETLTKAEKRFIKLLGKARAGNADSQQLELFDWINQAEPNAHIPENAKFRNNLATVSNRLKDLILDGLRLLNKVEDTDALLRTTLDEIATLFKKKLYDSAFKQSKRAKKLALSCCRYSFVLQCLEWEQTILHTEGSAEKLDALQQLRREEKEVLQKMEDLRELHFRHECLRSLAAQFLAARDIHTQGEIRALAEGDLVQRHSEGKSYLEQALAINILCIQDILLREPLSALTRYIAFFEDWIDNPEWQIDQAPLLLYICRMYQNTCFQSQLTLEQVQYYLAQIPDFGVFAPDLGRDFKRLLYHNRLSLALNTGNFEAAKGLIPEIDQWLTRESAHLPESAILPFLHNFAVIEFIHSEFAAANRLVQRILKMPNRKARQDIRDFAVLFRAILQYEIGQSGLDEYLTRAGKRHFAKQSRQYEFEVAVFQYLDKTLRVADSKELLVPLTQLSATLDALSEQLPCTSPVLGLIEVRLWAKAKLEGKPFKSVFMEAVLNNLEELG